MSTNMLDFEPNEEARKLTACARGVHTPVQTRGLENAD